MLRRGRGRGRLLRLHGLRSLAEVDDLRPALLGHLHGAAVARREEQVDRIVLGLGDHRRHERRERRSGETDVDVVDGDEATLLAAGDGGEQGEGPQDGLALVLGENLGILGAAPPMVEFRHHVLAVDGQVHLLDIGEEAGKGRRHPFGLLLRRPLAAPLGQHGEGVDPVLVEVVVLPDRGAALAELIGVDVRHHAQAVNEIDDVDHTVVPAAPAVPLRRDLAQEVVADRGPRRVAVVVHLLGLPLVAAGAASVFTDAEIGIEGHVIRPVSDAVDEYLLAIGRRTDVLLAEEGGFAGDELDPHFDLVVAHLKAELAVGVVLVQDHRAIVDVAERVPRAVIVTQEGRIVGPGTGVEEVAVGLEGLDERGLAGTRLAVDAEDIALLDRQLEVLERAEAVNVELERGGSGGTVGHLFTLFFLLVTVEFSVFASRN